MLETIDRTFFQNNLNSEQNNLRNLFIYYFYLDQSTYTESSYAEGIEPNSVAVKSQFKSQTAESRLQLTHLKSKTKKLLNKTLCKA